MWFDDSDAEAKLLEFLADYTTGEDGTLSLGKETTSLLDLGCGNGSLLFALRDEDWEGRALGVDYSEKSIALARQIAATRADEEEDDNREVEFAVWDVLAGAYDTLLSGDETEGWDVVLDKGTFDAISLSRERDASGLRICEAYKGRVLKLVKPNGVFLVTSCNWTEGELKAWFEEEGETEDENTGNFAQVGRVQYPSFSFGGVKGQTISTLCFQRIVRGKP